MKKKRKDVIVSRLEGQSNDFTLQRYGIFRFPVVALFKPNSKHIYSIFQNQRVFDELNKWVNDTCPVIDDKKEKNIVYHKIASFKEIHEGIISDPSSKINVMVLPTDEEIMIVKDTFNIAINQ